MYKSSAYQILPFFLQNILISSRSFFRNIVTNSPLYRRHISEIFSTQWMSHQELHQYQNDKIYSVLESCKQYIPFYKHILPNSLKPYRDDIFPLLHSLPLTDKSTILKCPKKFLNDNKFFNIFKGSTSGSTGTPFQIYQDHNTITREAAFIFRQLSWTGYAPRDPRVWIRGDMIVPTSTSTGPFWRYDYTQNMLLMSSYHISPKTCKSYISAIESFRPALIQAYPSSIGTIAKYLDFSNKDIKCDSIRAILVSSETLSPEIKNIIEKRFGAKVYNWYGSFERIMAIGTCEHGTLHLLTDYGYTELINSLSDTYTAHGTTFHNHTMPLIRYKMNDEFLGYHDNYKCKCGRTFPVIEKILGRDDDYIITPEGNRIGRLAHVLDNVAGIMAAQIFQNSTESITVFVIPAPDVTQKSYTEVIIKNMRTRLGNKIKIVVEPVSELKKTRNGKVKFVLSNIKENSSNKNCKVHTKN